MTEVPEHLLRRARERRAALTGGGAPAESAPAEAEEGEGAGAPGTAVEPAARGAPPAAAPAAEVVAEPDVTQSPAYIALQQQRRTRIPAWVMPVLVFLPFWGILYAGAFGSHEKPKVVDPLVLGQQVFASAGCSSCHGAQGQGAVGPKLAGGEAVKTFPNEADHITWVHTGGAPFIGKGYGDPDRDGGQHTVSPNNVMPAFGGTLSDAQIAAVVKYEREKL